MLDRKTKVQEILQSVYGGSYIYLGEGNQGVVFHDDKSVYKVFLNDWIGTDRYKSEMAYMQSIIPIINQSVYLYPVLEFRQFEDLWILVYPYEPSTSVILFQREDMIGFLAELWQLKLVMLNIKPDNFVMSNRHIRLIDYEFVAYSDNFFLNMCVRTFIYLKYAEKPDSSFLTKLNRSAINNFALPELDGIQQFVNDVFGRIIYEESKQVIPKNKIDINLLDSKIKVFDKELNLEKLFFQNSQK